MKQIFISYSRESREYAKGVKNILRAVEGVNIIIDSEFLKPGDEITEVIQQKLDVTDILLVLICSASLGSKWCDMEVKYCRERNKKIIPIFVENLIKTSKPKLNKLFSDIDNILYLPKDIEGDFKAIKEWDPINKAYIKIVESIKIVIDNFKAIKETTVESLNSNKKLLGAKPIKKLGNFSLPQLIVNKYLTHFGYQKKDLDKLQIHVKSPFKYFCSKQNLTIEAIDINESRDKNHKKIEDRLKIFRGEFKDSKSETRLFLLPYDSRLFDENGRINSFEANSLDIDYTIVDQLIYKNNLNGITYISNSNLSLFERNKSLKKKKSLPKENHKTE